MTQIRFDFSDDGKTFIDHETHLTWQSNVPDKLMTFNQAKAYASKLRLDGGGWRVPSLDELESLVYKGKARVFEKSTIRPSTYPELSDITKSDLVAWYWASVDSYSGGSGSYRIPATAAAVNFGSGFSSNIKDFTYTMRVRCVR